MKEAAENDSCTGSGNFVWDGLALEGGDTAVLVCKGLGIGFRCLMARVGIQVSASIETCSEGRREFSRQKKA